jgi:hypothetical protein
MLVTWLGMTIGLGVVPRLVLAVTPVTTLLLAIKATQLLFGQERIVYYEQELLTIAATALVAAAVGAPVVTMVDLATLGVGAFLACGRFGCFRVACCYGRRARIGVAYRHEHARAGFPSRWVGLRLFPIQLVDAAVAAAMVSVGVWLWLDGAEPGVAACTYTAGYGVARFALELARGDAARPIAGGVTEAQWIALGTTAAAAIWHPLWWTIGAASVVSIGAATLLAARRLGWFERIWLSSPWHVAEVSSYLAGVATGATGVTVTREGLRLSAARLPDGRLDVVVSRSERPPRVRAIEAMAAQLGNPWVTATVVPGRTSGLFHLILDDRIR